MGLKKEAYQLLIEDHHFDFSRGLGFPIRQPEDKSRWNSHYVRQIPFPIVITEMVIIYSLNLSNCRYKKLSKKILQFKDLKHLHLRMNILEALPSWLPQLKHLESIDLRDNFFKEFPMVLAELPNLKQIDLRENDCSSIPSAFLSKKADCVVLIDS